MPHRILIVDDQPIHVTYWKRALQAAGIDVVEATSTNEAREIYSASTFDLILLDRIMPPGLFSDLEHNDQTDTGVFIYEDIRSYNKTVPVLLFTMLRDEKVESIRDKDPLFFITDKISSAPDVLAQKVRLIIEEGHDLLEVSQLHSRARQTEVDKRLKQVIGCMRPDKWAGLYILGSFDRRITFYSQQTRALNLAHALSAVGGLTGSERVAIVGGGIAGMTAGVAFAKLGCNVTIFDASEALLHFQASANHRYLHPHIYDWPTPGSLDANARLPVLNWSANMADSVAGDLHKKFVRYVLKYPNLVHSPRSKITNIVQLGGNDGIQLLGNLGDIDDRFAIVIVCVGFGLDCHGVGASSYWTPDPLDGPFPRDPYRILVSGSGDGGLVDLARAKLRATPGGSAFRHDLAVQWLTQDPAFQSIGREMLAIDVQIRTQMRLGHNAANLYTEYRKLNIPREILEAVTDLRRPETKVAFHYRSATILKPDTSLINRLLALLLIRSELVDRRQGELELVGLQTAKTEFRSVKFVGPTNLTEEFDLVIRRHGPDPDHFAASFPDLSLAASVLSGRIVELEITDTLDPATAEWWSTMIDNDIEDPRS